MIEQEIQKDEIRKKNEAKALKELERLKLR